MRFHRDNPDKPWPLGERLGESSPSFGYLFKSAAYLLGIAAFIDIVRWLIHAATQLDPQPIAWDSIPRVAGEFWLFLAGLNWVLGFSDLQQESITFEELLLQKLDRRDSDSPITIATPLRKDDVKSRTEMPNALASLRAKERNERNREIRRRAKERKAAAIEKRTQEQDQVTLRAVAESLEYEQRLRNQTAVEYGWPIHPNDVEGLTPEQQAAMLEAWRERQPPPEFLSGGVS